MHIRKLSVASLILLSLPAAADFVVVSKAYEVAVADMRLPGSSSGTVTFKECAKCEYETVRVTNATRYEVNGHNVTLGSFRDTMDAIEDPHGVTATVLRHLESNTIKAVRVWL